VITTNALEVIAIVNGLAARVRDPKPVLERVAEHQASKVLTSIMSDKDDPDAHPWAEWRPFTRQEREKKGNTQLGLLWDTGNLLQSIKVNVGRGGFQIGTNVPYADELQYGRQDMAPRPFLGWSAQDIAIAERSVMAYIEGPL
jgi:phage gpG-like protein